MQLQALITAEELPIHLHIRGQSERTALRKLQPRNLQPLSSGGEHSHIHTFISTITLSPSLSLSHTHTHTHTRTRTHTLVLVVSLPGSLNSSMRALFTKVNSPSDSPPCFVCTCVSVCELVARGVCVCASARLACTRRVCVLFILCVGPAEGWEAVLHVARPHKRAVQPKFGAWGKLLNKLILHCSLIRTGDKLTSVRGNSLVRARSRCADSQRSLMKRRRFWFNFSLDLIPCAGDSLLDSSDCSLYVSKLKCCQLCMPFSGCFYPERLMVPMRAYSRYALLILASTHWARKDHFQIKGFFGPSVRLFVSKDIKVCWVLYFLAPLTSYFSALQ